jgi:hypothetical protein
LKFSDAPPVHRPLTGKGWRGFDTPHLTSTDDKESAIIAIFIDPVIFPHSSGLPAPIWRELAALGRQFRSCISQHIAITRIVLNSRRPTQVIGTPAEQSVARRPSTLSAPNH